MAANRIALAFALGVFLLNLLLGSWNAPATGDGYEEVRHFREEKSPRPQHLLLTKTWRAAHAVLSKVAPGLTPLRTMVLVNAASGSLALALALRMGIALGIGARALGLALAVLAASWAWWLHSRDSESTMIAHALLVGSAFVLVQGRTLRNRLRVLCVALFTLAAAIAANVLAALPLLVLLERWRSARRWYHPRTLFFAVALVLPFLGICASQYAAHRHEIDAPFDTWLRRHSSEDMMGKVGRGPTPTALLRAGTGLLRCFLPLEGGVPSAIKLRLTGREAASVSGPAIAKFAAAALLTLLLLLLFVRAVLAARWNREAHRAFAAGFLGTALGCWIWLGSDPQFWLPILPFLFVGAAAGWETVRNLPSRWVGWTAFVALAFLLVMNAPWPTPSLLHRAGGPAWRAAGEFCDVGKPGDLLIAKDTLWSFYVVERCQGMQKYRLLYESTATGEQLLAEIEAAIDATLASGRRVVMEDFSSPPSLAELGFWENMAVAKGISREELCARLADRYRLEPLLMEDAPRLLHLTLPTRISSRKDGGSSMLPPTHTLSGRAEVVRARVVSQNLANGNRHRAS